MLEEVKSKREFEDTKEMVQWRSITQKEVDNQWKELCGAMEEEVLDNYKGDERRVCTEVVVSRWNGESSKG